KVGGAMPRPQYDIVSAFFTASVLLPLTPSNGYRPRVLLCGADTAYTLDLGDFDPRKPGPQPTWTPTKPRMLQSVRQNLSALLLPTGEVLVSGGCSGNPDGSVPDETGVQAAELYQPATGEWLLLEEAAVVRNYHSVALLMPDGRVWTAGSSRDHSQSFNPPFKYQDIEGFWSN